MHYRRQVREAVVQRLKDAATMAGANVFSSRARPVLEILRKHESVLNVYTSDEASSRAADGSVRERTLLVTVEGITGGGDDIDEALDLMCEQIEAAIDADPTLGTLLGSDLELANTVTDIGAVGNMIVGAVRLDFEATYYTTAPAVEIPAEFPVPDDFDPSSVQVSILPIPTAEALEPADDLSGDSFLDTPTFPDSPDAPMPGETAPEGAGGEELCPCPAFAEERE